MTPKKVATYLRVIMIVGGVCLVVGVTCIIATFLVPTVHIAVLWAGIISVMIGILLFAPALISM